MYEDETIYEFYRCLCENFDEAYVLDTKDITNLKLDELIGLLRIFEMNLEAAKRNKIRVKKNIAFNAQKDFAIKKSTIESIDEINDLKPTL
ncbi:hypothetical protein Golob_014537 [Gossypium lobatum]|uniref:Uncharacterized protein n=1 Tax=Gossypium lobatum TaxID=34289 RepID=A0A7J8LYD1_9ROSI|nr:hypothetical protein [Gossypium lobatum]